MKFIRKLIIPILFYVSMHAVAAPVAPTLNYSVEYHPEGPVAIIKWNDVPGATKYKLLYAPIPYTGPDSIGSIDIVAIEGHSIFYADLWEGAAFYVAIQSGDETGFSGYSNIESIVITSSESINLAGNWTLKSFKNDCGINLNDGNVVIKQLGDYVTISLPGGGSVLGDLNEDQLGVIGNVPMIGEGADMPIEISFLAITPGSNNLSGYASWGTYGACSGESQFLLSR